MAEHGYKDDHKRDGKRHNETKTASQTSAHDDANADPLLILWAYRFVDGEHVLDNTVEDEHGVPSGALTSLNRKGRWDLPEFLEQRAEETKHLLEKDELNNDPLVIVFPVSESREARWDGWFTKEAESEKLIKRVPRPDGQQSSSEEEGEEGSDEGEEKEIDNRTYEVTQNRKGRVVREVGARNKNKKARRAEYECRKISSALGKRDHHGPIYIYHIFDPKWLRKRPQKDYGPTCFCERCNPQRPARGKRNDTLFKEQL